MKKSLWVTMWISNGFVVFGASLALFLPETLERTKVADFAPETISDEETEQVEDRPTSSHRKSLKQKLAKLFGRVQGSHFIFASPMLFGLSLVFLLQRLSGNVVDLMIQLASERFHWDLGDVSLIHGNFSSMGRPSWLTVNRQASSSPSILSPSSSSSSSLYLAYTMFSQHVSTCHPQRKTSQLREEAS
jgi:hypothetical protein